MATGTIKRIHNDRGFGFLAPEGDGGEDLFFHHTGVANGAFEQLREGQRVSFDEGEDPRNPGRKRAVNVQPEGDEA